MNFERERGGGGLERQRRGVREIHRERERGRDRRGRHRENERERGCTIRS